MADEQTPQSDLVEDALRQAERQLEAKIEALRLSALADPVPQASALNDAVDLRPTTSAITHETLPVTNLDQLSSTPTANEADHQDPARWEEVESDDLTFAPTKGMPHTDQVTSLFVPDGLCDEDANDSDTASDSALNVFDDDQHREAGLTSLHESLTATVTDLTPVWEDDDQPHLDAPSPILTPSTRPAPASPSYDRESRLAQDQPRSRRQQPSPRIEDTHPALPTEDEMQFWAHTRTALRNLQQVTDGLPIQVVGGVSTEIARLLHEELALTENSLHALNEQLRQLVGASLPSFSSDIQHAIDQSLTTPNHAINQVREEIPTHLKMATQRLTEAVREDLERTSAGLHGALQHDIVSLEQSIASNVTRMAQDSGDAITRVERDVDVLGETVVRFERGVHAEFDRFEAQLRSAVERVEENLREDLVEPTELIRKLNEENEPRLMRLERALEDQLKDNHREQHTALTSLVESDRAAIDRLTSIASTLDDDRARRAEDLEVVVDTITRGWEAIAGAMATLFDQAETNSRRIAGIEQRLLQLRDVEGAMQQTLDEFTQQMRELKPAPIVVTVAHDEAEVRNATRGGWTPDA